MINAEVKIKQKANPANSRYTRIRGLLKTYEEKLDLDKSDAESLAKELNAFAKAVAAQPSEQATAQLASVTHQIYTYAQNLASLGQKALADFVDAFDPNIVGPKMQLVGQRFINDAESRKKTLKYFEWDRILRNANIHELSLSDTMKVEVKAFTGHATFLQNLVPVTDAMASIAVLQAPNPETRPDGMTQADTIKMMKCINDLKHTWDTLEGVQGKAAVQAISKFTDVVTPRSHAKEMAADKLDAWFGSVKALMETWSGTCGGNTAAVSAAVVPTLATLNTQIYSMRQVAPCLPEEKGGKNIFDWGELFMNAVGNAESCKAFDDLSAENVTIKKVLTLGSTKLGMMVKAWKEFCLNPCGGRLQMFKVACPGVEASSAAKMDLFMTQNLQKFERIGSVLMGKFQESMAPLRKDMETTLASVYDKDDPKEFLKVFKVADLKKMSPIHGKFSSFLKQAKEISLEFGLDWDVAEMEEFATRCRCLSIKWGIYTIYDRLRMDVEPARSLWNNLLIKFS
jgi:hypothetical protein